MFEEYNNGVPDRLRQVTAETMSPEVLYIYSILIRTYRRRM